MPENIDIGVQLTIERLYVKAVDFKIHETPQVFDLKWQPDVQLNIQSKHDSAGSDRYEVVLIVNLTGKVQERDAVEIHLEQAGLFRLKSTVDEAIDHVLNVTCMNILFPYAREVIDNLALKGSLPAFNLAPFEFAKMFERAMQELKPTVIPKGRRGEPEVLN